MKLKHEGSEPLTAVFPVRVPMAHLMEVARIAKKQDKTKGAVIREAIKIYLERRSA